MAKSTKNMDLVPQEALEQLKQLDSQLDSTKKNLAELLKPVVDISTELQKSATNYKELIDVIGKYNEIEKKAANEAKKQKQTLSEVERLRAKLKDSESGQAKEAAKLREELRRKNEELRNSAKLNSSTANSVERLRARVSQLKKEWAGMDMDDAGFDELGKQLQEANEELKKLEQNVGISGRNVGNYEEAIKSALGVNGNFADSLMNMSGAGGGFNGFLKNAGSSVKAFGATLLTLLANPVFLAIAGIAGAGAAFKFWYDYNKGLQEATKLTMQFTGLSGDGMKHYRNEVQAIADTYGKDFKEVIAASNAVSKQFGIEQAEALKLVRDGFVSGADANGEFLDNLREYPVFFKEAGVSASEFIAITTQANQSGIYSDKAIDTIKEGNIRIREMTTATAAALEGIGISSSEVQRQLSEGSMTTFEVMQLVSSKLKELPADSAAVGTAIADIFGGPGEDAGLQYIRTLATINTDLDAVKANAGELATLQDRQLESQIELENALSDLLDSTGGTFENIITEAKIFVNDILISMINGIKSAGKWFKSLYDDSMLWRGAIEGISLVFSGLWDTVKTGFKNTGALIKGAGNAFKALISGDFGGIGDAFKNAWKEVRDNGKAYGANLAKDVAAAFKNTIEGRKDDLTVEAEVDAKVKVEAPKEFNGKLRIPAETEEQRKEREKRAKKLAENLKKYAEEERKAKESMASAGLQTTIDTNKAIVSDTKRSYDERKRALGDYTGMLVDSLEKQKEAEVNALVRKAQSDLGIEDEAKAREEVANQILIIETKAATEIEKVRRESADAQVEIEKYRVGEIINGLTKEAEARARALSAEETGEYSGLSEQYSKGLMSEEVYQAKRKAIADKYAMERFNSEMGMLGKQLAQEGLTGDERTALLEKQADARLEYNQWVVQQEMAAEEELAARKKQLLQDVFNFGKQLVSQRFENQLEALEEESEANDEWAEEEKERIDNLEESGAISKEQAEARKAAIDQQSEAREEELERKRAEIKKKQAIFERAMAVADIVRETAMSILKIKAQIAVLASNPITAAYAAVAASQIPWIVAAGAAQTAAILATPIPEYATGTEDHPGGLAIVGDGGKSEMVIANGAIYKTPASDTLVDLPKHAVVLPDFNAAMLMQNTPRIPEREDRSLDLGELPALMKDTNNKISSLLKMEKKRMKNDMYARELNNIRRIAR